MWQRLFVAAVLFLCAWMLSVVAEDTPPVWVEKSRGTAEAVHPTTGEVVTGDKFTFRFYERPWWITPAGALPAATALCVLFWPRKREPKPADEPVESV